jgi:hypothetical protein
MTGRPLDDETEEAMRLCESRMYSLGSPEWNALRDRIRALLRDRVRAVTISPEQAKAYITATHRGGADECPACSCRRKLADIAELAS